MKKKAKEGREWRARGWGGGTTERASPTAQRGASPPRPPPPTAGRPRLRRIAARRRAGTRRPDARGKRPPSSGGPGSGQPAPRRGIGGARKEEAEAGRRACAIWWPARAGTCSATRTAVALWPGASVGGSPPSLPPSRTTTLPPLLPSRIPTTEEANHFSAFDSIWLG